MRTILLAAGAALIATAAPAAATTVNFDDLANGAVVTNQYPGLTFSSIAGSQVLVTAQSYGSSLPNFICTGRSGTINCTDPLFVDFATDASGISFLAVGDDASGVNGSVSVFGEGGVLLGTASIVGDGVLATPYTVDLSAFTGVRRLEITTTDPAGLGYDDFTFSAGGGGTVPEPASWAMMIMGIAATGFAMRRRSTINLRFA